MFLFILGIVVFCVFAIGFSISLALWTYEDAKVKSEESPILWLLFVLLVNPIGIIVYLLEGRAKKDVPPPGKYKKAMLFMLVCFILSAPLFAFGTINFVINVESSGVASVSSMSSTFSRSVVRNDVWSFTARSANGWERRSPNLSAEQLANFHVFTDSGEGVTLLLVQGDVSERINISGFFAQNIDMSAFQPGSIRITLELDRARDIDVRISWRAR
jgi:hypothetical protein